MFFWCLYSQPIIRNIPVIPFLWFCAMLCGESPPTAKTEPRRALCCYVTKRCKDRTHSAKLFNYSSRSWNEQPPQVRPWDKQQTYDAGPNINATIRIEASEVPRANG
ncbi:hypothetical protein BOTBODRAFT_279640 [Botryobasidium botryosum FD-172 SS1]|uniref:Uncharacterized protein n=1 Tax=Botryobasidium botryosum (strain FD-172 SS1) TaxID=930990 RepID=A0A067LRT8_BOTB1|nr:hypothetical protein BOTBODRAFT_279640 [Botryobasidium botryosum FD-172 SS1]